MEDFIFEKRLFYTLAHALVCVVRMGTRPRPRVASACASQSSHKRRAARNNKRASAKTRSSVLVVRLVGGLQLLARDDGGHLRL